MVLPGPVTVSTVSGETGETLFGSTLFGINKVRPVRPEQRPRYRPDIPCETNEPPNLAAAAGGGEQQAATSTSTIGPKELAPLADYVEKVRAGKDVPDPLNSALPKGAVK